MIRSVHRLCHKTVSRRNWHTVQPLLSRAIADADFVAIDFELTGLHAKNDRYIGIAQSYEAHCQGAKSFLPVQLGICAAKFDNGTQTWSLTPASIYLYPSSTSEEATQCFSVSTAALNFLVANGFDCNEWITQGLGWLKPAEEADRRKTVQTRIDEVRHMMTTTASVAADAKSSSFSPMDIPEGPDRESMNVLRSQINEWLTAGSEVPLEVPMESAFLRLLAHTFISHEFPALFSHSVRRGDLRVLCIYKNKQELFQEQLLSLEAEMDKIDTELGARHLFDTLSKFKTPLVGHNCFYDLLHTYQSFYEPVPPYVDQFKAKWMAKFPRTFDTKYLAESNEVLGGLQPPATLKGLCDFMAASTSGKLNVSVSPLTDEFQYYLPASLGKGQAAASDLSHDAGYDAMMTSVVFLLQLQHIMERKSLTFDQLDFGYSQTRVGEGQKLPIHELLRSGVNRIRLVKTQPPSINLRERE